MGHASDVVWQQAILGESANNDNGKLTVIYNKKPRIAIEIQLPQGNTHYTL